MTEFYTYNNTSISPLIHFINLHFKHKLIGAEIGVGQGVSMFEVLEKCELVKMYYGIDSYLPFEDHITYGKEKIYYDQKSQDLSKTMLYHYLKHSKGKEKIKIIEKESCIAVEEFPNEYFDFIFLDAFPTYENAVQDFTLWFPKLKVKGLFCGHDFNNKIIQEALTDFLKLIKLNKKLSIANDTWAFIK